MSAADNGGSAYPVSEVRDLNGCGITEASPGMSLRDWFAGKALAGYLAANPETEVGYDAAAQRAYAYADAMITTRARPTGEPQ